MMNIRKFLAAGLIASVAVASAEASNDCVNGGFYIQGGFGISTTKMKYKNNLDPQLNSLIAEELANMRPVNVSNYQSGLAPGNNVILSTIVAYCLWDIATYKAGMDAVKTSLSKRKNLFQFEFGTGLDKRIGSVMLGISVNFGKNFGNVKKKEKGLAYRTYQKQASLVGLSRDTILPQGVNSNAGVIQNTVVNGIAPAGNAGSSYSNDPANFINVNGAQMVRASDINTALLYQRDLELEFKCKNKYYLSIMPRFGILVNPRLELYVTAGVKIKSDKYTIYIPSSKKSSKKTVTKCIPVVGLGLQYNFKNGIFMNLSYMFNFKAKKTFKFKANNELGMDATVKHTLQNSSNDIKFGFGYRF